MKMFREIIYYKSFKNFQKSLYGAYFNITLEIQTSKLNFL